MKQSARFTRIIFVLLFAYQSGVGQRKEPMLPLTADSLASGTYKDVLKSFFQLAIDKLTGNDKEIRFTSNPFAVMAKLDTGLLVDTNYIRYTHLRNLNFSFGIKLDSSYRFNGFSSGLKYALINKTDETVSREFVKAAYEANDENNKLSAAITAYISTIDLNDPRRQSYSSQRNDFFGGKINFSQLDKDFQNTIKLKAKELNLVNFLALVKENERLNIGGAKKMSYDSLRKVFQKGLLWTVGMNDTTYKNQFLFSHLVFNTELIKGLGVPKPGSNWDFDIKANMDLADDTATKGRDLKRAVFDLEPGFNWIVRGKGSGKSFLEVNFSGSYYHNFTRLYQMERRDRITLNGTIRIRIINDIWLPLQIWYDPSSGNVFGFMNVRINFTGLTKWARNQSK